MQDLERGKRAHHARLLIAHTRSVSTLLVHAEGTCSGRAGTKDRVDMRNDQDSALAAAMKDCDQIVGQPGGFRRFTPHLGAQWGQSGGEYSLNFGAAFDIAGSGIDVDDLFQQVQNPAAIGFHCTVDFFIAGRGVCATDKKQSQNCRRGSCNEFSPNHFPLLPRRF